MKAWTSFIVLCGIIILVSFQNCAKTQFTDQPVTLSSSSKDSIPLIVDAEGAGLDSETEERLSAILGSQIHWVLIDLRENDVSVELPDSHFFRFRLSTQAEKADCSGPCLLEYRLQGGQAYCGPMTGTLSRGLIENAMINQFTSLQSSPSRNCKDQALDSRLIELLKSGHLLVSYWGGLLTIQVGNVTLVFQAQG